MRTIIFEYSAFRRLLSNRVETVLILTFVGVEQKWVKNIPKKTNKEEIKKLERNEATQLSKATG